MCWGVQIDQIEPDISQIIKKQLVKLKRIIY